MEGSVAGNGFCVCFCCCVVCVFLCACLRFGLCIFVRLLALPYGRAARTKTGFAFCQHRTRSVRGARGAKPLVKARRERARVSALSTLKREARRA